MRTHPSPPLSPPQAPRPATWRWIAFFTCCLVVVSLWVPPVSADADRNSTEKPTVDSTRVAILGVTVLLAVLVLPATWRWRVFFAVLLVGSTFAAWALEEPIRKLLGSPFWP